MAQGMVRRFLGKACLSRALPALLVAACPAVRGASIMSGTYVGGGLEDVCAVVATDGGGNVYVAGHTGSSGWVGGGGDTTQNGQRDAFVVKFSPSGDHLWSTFLGGESEDDASGIALDGAGNVLVSGSTSSSGWVSGGVGRRPEQGLGRGSAVAERRFRGEALPGGRACLVQLSWGGE